jgi:hypothetical protein
MARTPIYSGLAYFIESRVGCGRALTTFKVCGVWEKLGTSHFPSCKNLPFPNLFIKHEI